MVDRINKALLKMPPKERAIIIAVLEDLQAGRISSHDLKKLRGPEQIYRIRKGSFRIIFFMPDPKTIRIITIERRTDMTYNEL
jgi:mRNA-degrading endonuclease RelE of RelBE toxin-antitoxin system